MKTPVLFVVAAVFLVAGAAARAQTKTNDPVHVKISGIEARFFYEGTGALSDNIAPPATFRAWNSMIGEGDAKQPANDLVVSVALTSDRVEANVATPLTLTVTRANGRVVAKRTFKSLFFKNGKLVKALFVPDAACLGKATIKAVVGAEKRLTNVELDCGE